MIRAVLFDLDGTLVDCERETAEGMARALASLGITVDSADRTFVIGRSWLAIHERLRRRYELGWSVDELIAKVTAERDKVLAAGGPVVLPGARDAVRRLADRRLGLVTGSSRHEASQMLKALALEGVFGCVVAAEDVARSKPAPDPYLAAAGSLGVAPGECAVIEDSSAGIAAALAAGCLVFAVRAGNFSGQDQSDAHFILDTLDELSPDLIDHIEAVRADGGWS